MSRPHVVSPSELHALRDLELATRATVEGLRHGLHRSPFHGYSAEFSQYRHYRPGDDLKYVDWKLFGRTDRFYTRQFRETTNLAALVVVDVSASMGYPALGPQASSSSKTKLGLATSVAAILGTLVLDQGDAAGVLAVDDRAHYVPPRSGGQHLRSFLAALGELRASGARNVSDGLRRAAAVLKRRGLVIVLSDLYEEEDAISQVRRLARMGHDVIVIHALASEEITLDVGGAAEFVDVESGAALNVQPSAIADAYRSAVGRWLADVERQLRSDGVDYLRVTTGEPLEPVLRRFLVARRSVAR